MVSPFTPTNKIHLQNAQANKTSPAGFKSQYKKIDANWTFNSARPIYQEPTEYLGSHGTGELHEEFGSGEYLDRTAMKQAQVSALSDMPLSNLRYIPIIHLTLGSFAVDAGPFVSRITPHTHLRFILTSTQAHFH
jgi:hypothetical protein